MPWLDVILDDGFFDGVMLAADRLQSEMRRLMAAHPSIVDEVRGKGLMLGFRLSDAHINADIVARLLQNGLLTVPAGDNVIRLLPPLTIGEAEIEEAISSIEELFQELVDASADQPEAAS